MENPFNHFDSPNPFLGFVYSVASIVFAILTWIKLQDVQVVAATAASIAAMVSAVLGARYFIFATKEKKQLIEKNKITTP